MSHTPKNQWVKESWIAYPSTLPTEPSVWIVGTESGQGLLGTAGFGKEWSTVDAEIARHIAEVHNGCAGLNPAAYRECVEALRTIVNILPDGNSPSHLAAKRALSHAEAPHA